MKPNESNHDTTHFEIHARLSRLEHIMFGDDDSGEKGMKKKIDEMYDILTQAKGWKSLGVLIIMIGAVFGVLKTFLFTK